MPEHDVCCGDGAIDRLYLMEADQYATDRPLEFLKMTHHEMKSRIILSSRNPRHFFTRTPQKPDAKIASAPTRYITLRI
jgi:hypothetical protein